MDKTRVQKGIIRKKISRIKITIVFLFLLIVLLTGYMITNIPGEKTITFFYSNEKLIIIADSIIPSTWKLSYYGTVIQDKESLVQGDFYGGTASYTSSPNAQIELDFIGTKVEWVGYLSEYFGIAEVLIDNEFIKNVDLYSEKTMYNQSIFVSGELPYDKHTLSIRATGNKNTHAMGYSINVDYINLWKMNVNHIYNNDHPEINYVNPNQYYYLQFISRKIFHILIYFVLTFIFIIIVKLYKMNGRRLFTIPWIILFIAVIDEYLQSFVEGRHSYYADVIIDLIGMILAFFVFITFNILRRLLMISSVKGNGLNE